MTEEGLDPLEPESEVVDQEVEQAQESDVLPEEREEVEEPESAEIEHDDEEVEEGEVEQEAAAYDANFTYNVKDEVYEMPDKVREYIKSPEDEEFFRDLFSAADGVPGLVQDRQILRDDNSRLMQTEQTRQGAVQQLQSFVANEDLKPFMDAWNIDDQKLARYMQQRINLQEMQQNDPAGYAEYQRNEQAKLSSYNLANQNQYLQSQNQQLQEQQLNWQVDQTLSNSEFSEHARNYDSAKGEGAFKRKIAERGDYYWHTGRGVVPPEQLAREVMQDFYYHQPQQQQHASPAKTGATRGRPRVVSRNEKPTMPRARGTGGSPVKSMPKSIERLREIAQEKGYGS